MSSSSPPLWVIAVGGKAEGQARELSDRPLIIGDVTAAAANAAGSDHWLIEGLQPLTFLSVASECVRSDAQTIHRNLFLQPAPRLLPRDLIEWHDQVMLLCERPPLALPEWQIFSLLAPDLPMPRVFHSVYAEGPFQQCLVCESDFSPAGPGYVVEKVYRGREVVMECAICAHCALALSRELSEESRNNLEAHFSKLEHAEGGLSHCRFCSKHRSTLSGFSTIAHACLGDLTAPKLWFLVCDQCNESIEQLLSQQTRERYGEFYRDHFPGLPVDSDLPTPLFV